MENKKFAYESEEVSIVFYSTLGLGDALIARKVLEAVIELVPNCVVDFFCVTAAHRIYAKAFYGDIKNLNRLLDAQEYREHFNKYDFAFEIGGSHAIILEWVNVERLQAMAPTFLQKIADVDAYNKQNVIAVGPWYTSVAFRNMMLAKILHKSCYQFLSCGEALPIREDNFYIPLAPEFKSQFDALKLDKYITIYTDISEKEKDRPKVKTWSIKYFVEYIARMKKRFPNVEIVQCGGANDVKVENADRHCLGVDLELTKYILANSLLHVGCEGGLVHLATYLGTKCLVLFGANGVDYFGYDRNINLVSEVCSPCVHSLPNFQTCLRGNVEPPCMLSHTPQLVCEVTCNYLKNKA